MVTAVNPTPSYPDTHAAEEHSIGYRDPMTTAPDASDGTEMSFGDFVDIINPLQHIPVIAPIYRAITGDQITQEARSVGGFLYGGPIGMILTGVQMMAEDAAGTTPEKAIASLFGSETTAKAETATQNANKDAAAESGTPSSVAAAATGAAPTATLAQRNGAAMQDLARDLRGLTKGMVRRSPFPAPATLALPPAAPAKVSAETNSVDRVEKPEKAAIRARRHHNLPPDGAKSDWYAAAMERALAKYKAASVAVPSSSVRIDR